MSAFADLLKRGDVRDYNCLEKMARAMLTVDDACNEREAKEAIKVLEKAVTSLRKRLNHKVKMTGYRSAVTVWIGDEAVGVGDKLKDLEALG